VIFGSVVQSDTITLLLWGTVHYAHIMIILAGALSANSAYGTLHKDRRQCPDRYKGIAHSSRPDLAKLALHNWMHVIFLISAGFYDQEYALS